MRLINADELKKLYPQDEDWEYPVNTNSGVCEDIDNQPTIPAIPIEVLQEIRQEIEQEKVGYPPSADEYKTINKILEIIDKCIGERKNEEWDGEYYGEDC